MNLKLAWDPEKLLLSTSNVWDGGIDVGVGGVAGTDIGTNPPVWGPTYWAWSWGWTPVRATHISTALICKKCRVMIFFGLFCIDRKKEGWSLKVGVEIIIGLSEILSREKNDELQSWSDSLTRLDLNWFHDCGYFKEYLQVWFFLIPPFFPLYQRLGLFQSMCKCPVPISGGKVSYHT